MLPLLIVNQRLVQKVICVDSKPESILKIAAFKIKCMRLTISGHQVLLRRTNLQIITTRLVNICIKGAKKPEKNKDLSVSINEVWKVV